MQNLQWVTGTLMMVSSLRMTRMLTSSVVLFRARGHSPFDWVPFVWATCLFYSLLEFSFALTALERMKEQWTFQHFLELFAGVLVLFIASALILPASLEKGESLRASFERDGRWALAFLAAYEFLAIGLNHRFWQVDLWGFSSAFNLVLGLVAVAMLVTRRRKAECALTLLFAGLEVFSILLLG